MPLYDASGIWSDGVLQVPFWLHGIEAEGEPSAREEAIGRAEGMYTPMYGPGGVLEMEVTERT